MSDASAHAGRSCRLQSGGFSLLELIVVLSLIAVLTGMLVPMFSSSVSSIQFRNARNDFIARVQFVQELAVRDSREYRVCLDKDKNTYWVERLVAEDKGEKIFEPVEEDYALPALLPPFIELTKVKARKDRKSNTTYIGCYPNGASDRAEITFVDKRTRGRVVRMETLGVVGKVEVTKER